MPEFIKGLFTTAQAAEQLHVRPEYVRNLIAQGKLHGVRNGPNWFLSCQEIEEFSQSYNPRTHRRTVERVNNLSIHTLAILSDLSEWGMATADDIAKTANRVAGNVRKHLNVLQKAGLVEKTNSDAPAYWQVTQMGKAQLHGLPSHIQQKMEELLAS